jgi:hypothetical protein
MSARATVPTASVTPKDDTAPQTTLESGPAPRTVPVFVFTADEPATFECSLDGGSFESCVSPMRYDDLNAGWHTFAVRATDLAGNVDPSPAEARWHVTGHVTDGD